MIGTIDGADVYLSEDQLPAFTLSAGTLANPVAVSSSSSTTIRVISTPESAIAIGNEYAATVAPNRRPELRVSEGSVDLFRSVVLPIRKNRNEIECVAVGGNAAWFEDAKSTKLHDMKMGITDPLDAAMQRDSWNDVTKPVYFPLIDFGSFANRANTYDVPVTDIRPAIRTHSFIAKFFSNIGYTFIPRGSLADVWERIVLMDTEAEASVWIAQPYAATIDVTTSNPAPDLHSFIPTVNGTLDVTIVDMDIRYNATDYQLDGLALRVAVYDNTARVVLDWLDLPITYIGETGHGSKVVNHSFIGIQVTSGHDIYVAVQAYNAPAVIVTTTVLDNGTIAYDLNSGTQAITLRPSVSALYAIIPIGFTSDYIETYNIDIARVAPDWTVEKLIKTLATALAMEFTTNEVTKVVSGWIDTEYYKPVGSPDPRDWVGRIDHSIAPNLVEPIMPRRINIGYEYDENDFYLRRQKIRNAIEYGSIEQVNPYGTGSDLKITIPVIPSINGRVFDGVDIPVLRDITAANQVNAYGRGIRLFITNGLATGDWTHDGVLVNDYPVSDFAGGNKRIALPVGNASIDGVLNTASSELQWSRRLSSYSNPKHLEVYVRLRDHELRGFHHGVPTLVDDGSGPAWYYVQKIHDHQFGIGEATKCTLVKIGGAGELGQSVIPLTPPPAFSCSGAGYGGITTLGALSDIVTTSTGYVALRDAATGVVTVLGTGSGDITFTVPYAGTFCVYSCDAVGAASGDMLAFGDDAINWFGLSIIDITGYAATLTRFEMASYDLISFTGLELCTALEDVVIPAYPFPTLDVTTLVNATHLDVTDSISLNTLLIPPGGVLDTIDAGDTGIQNTNEVLAAIVASGITGGTIVITGGTSAAPTGAGITDKAYLIGTMGWTVNTN